MAFGLSLAVSGQSAAALFDNGNGLVYDSTLNVTWTKDANLLGTLEAANSHLVNTIVTTIGSVTDSQGVHGISAGDFGSNGSVDWWAAQAYVNYLNTISYDGSNQ